MVKGRGGDREGKKSAHKMLQHSVDMVNPRAVLMVNDIISVLFDTHLALAGTRVHFHYYNCYYDYHHIIIIVNVNIVSEVSNTCMLCRDSTTQLALLDRVAGTQAAAAKFGAQLQQLQQVQRQLTDIAAVGDEEEREELQQIILEVRIETAYQSQTV